MRMLLIMVLTFTLLSGCNTAHNSASPSSQNKSAKATSSDQRYHRITVKSAANSATRSTVHTYDQMTDLSIKDHLEALAKRVRGVDNAHAVVFGNTAIVGLDVNGKLTRSQVGNIKYSVAEALSKDPRGKNALVTADMDLSSRIAEIGRHIQKGEPVTGFASELADIVGRIVPQMSKDVKNHTNSAGVRPESRH